MEPSNQNGLPGNNPHGTANDAASMLGAGVDAMNTSIADQISRNIDRASHLPQCLFKNERGCVKGASQILHMLRKHGEP